MSVGSEEEPSEEASKEESGGEIKEAVEMYHPSTNCKPGYMNSACLAAIVLLLMKKT